MIKFHAAEGERRNVCGQLIDRLIIDVLIKRTIKIIPMCYT